MIELPEFPDENWYLSNIQHLFLNGHIKKDIYKKFISSPSVQDINNELTAIIPDSLFSDKSPNKLLFEKLILAPFEELEQVKAKVDSLNKDLFLTTTTKNNRESSIPIGVWKILYDSYDVFVRRKNNTKLIDKYGISCCPYCNENFIFNRNTVAMAQLDHFYPRDKYPIFSLCLI